MDDATEARLEALEQRVRALEDELALHRSIASYGPSVDAGDTERATSLWVEDGIYELVGWGTLAGRDGLRRIVDNPEHRAMLASGCAHLLLPPRIHIDGDEAQGRGVSVVLVRGDQGFEVARVSANHYRWRRTTDGWRMVARTNQLLDGEASARALLGDAETDGVARGD